MHQTDSPQNFWDKAKNATQQRLNKDSEFGTVIDEGWDGKIVRSPNGKIHFVSSAFNPLTVNDLEEIAKHMRELGAK